MLFDYGFADCQPHAHPVRLGRNERIKDLQNVDRKPGASVSEFHLDHLLHFSTSDGNDAILVSRAMHRLNSVLQKIDNNLFDLHAIDVNSVFGFVESHTDTTTARLEHQQLTRFL